ncbi:MAG: NAD(P)/FAD-dependent oxidoreductase [Myxococcales bacterium]
MIYDLAIAGGGPAGLATAIRAAQRGFKAVVLERSADPPDKACGEGLMPSGARELEGLGARVAQAFAFRGIRYLQEDGSAVEALFRDGQGLGIRRTVLARALRERALEAGAELRHATVQSVSSGAGAVEVVTAQGAVEARLAVAADGLHSPLRRAAGLDLPSAGPQRFGVRRHFALAPWTDLVEVYWADGVEAYVTPVGPRSVNVAFLTANRPGFDALLARFPALSGRLAGALPESETRGAGPLLQSVRARHADRLALIGDAAGYVDAITGQGLSLAFAAARMLIDALPADLSRDPGPALRAWDASLRRPWLRYALPARALVALSRRPALRRRAIRAAAPMFGALVRFVG